MCVYYMTGAPEGSPKVVLCGFMFFFCFVFFYGEAGNRTCDPWFTRHSAYPLHHGFSYRGGHIKNFNRQMVYYIIYNYDFSNIYELTEILISLKKIFFHIDKQSI